MFGYRDEAGQRAIAAARQFERKGDTVSARRAREFVDELTGRTATLTMKRAGLQAATS
jgi:hypothetical protein